MNTPMHFPTIDDKTIYQMGLNQGTAQPSSSYVPETSTAVLTNQILEILNPQTEDHKTRMFCDLMTPHYQKQQEIVDRLEKLTSSISNFIEAQQSINELIFDRIYKNLPPSPHENLDLLGNSTEIENHSTIQKKQQQQIICDLGKEPVVGDEDDEGKDKDSDHQMPEEMSVRDFLKSNLPTVMKRDSEMNGEMEELEKDEETDAEMMKRYNKFRVRHPPKKYKRNNSLSNNFSHSNNGHQQVSSMPSTSSQEPPQPLVSSLQQPQPAPIATISLAPPMTLQQPSIQLPSTSNFMPAHPQPIAHPSAQRLTDQIDPSLVQYSTPFLMNPPQPQLVPRLEENGEFVWKPSDLGTLSELQENESRRFIEPTNSHSFLPFPSTFQNEPHTRSAFVPAYHKERR